MMNTSLPRTSSDHRHQRVLIVDDTPHVREELRHLLTLSGGFEIVGEATNGREALQQAELLQPDTVLLDLEMPELDGWEAARLLKQRRLVDRIVVLSIHVDPQSMQRAWEAGADAFVPKGAGLDALIKALTDE